MAKLSSTLCFFLLVCVLGTNGIRDIASNVIVPNDKCLTALGVCSFKLCDEHCCEEKCLNNFKSQNPSGDCEMIHGSGLIVCNCYHDCDN
ncbi:hypothetical protein H5410_025073 [Solanum commersonii]|uniref:Uncharacterized protein n=2 Tax=Solanum TaxID=4107 RepID=A0ABQ7UR62_SOLTU|nr:hypothetical protein H5410_025073 [Solanum commersonii]KAH0753591.1 hypothetical protein KY290_023861 [Solanum tuberosum]